MKAQGRVAIILLAACASLPETSSAQDRARRIRFANHDRPLGQLVADAEIARTVSFNQDRDEMDDPFADDGDVLDALPMLAADGQAAACDECVSCDDAPWRLFPERCGWSITGWLSAGGTYNGDSPASRFNGPVTFNDRNEYQLNQLYAVLEKPVDADCCGVSWGGRVDVLFGTDYIFTQAAGLETRPNFTRKWNSGPQYGVALPQAYLEIARGNLSVKVGHFYTIIGNEVVTSPDNFFYSHAYTMQYGEPFTHSGLLATYERGNGVTLWAGAVNGWDKLDAMTDRTSVIGGVKWNSCDERTTVAIAGISGDEDGAGVVQGNRTMYSVVLSHALTDRMEYVIQHDHGIQYSDNAQDAEWYGINQYLLYSLNDCTRLGARLEWFRDDDGTRVGGIRGGNPNNAGFAGNFYEATLGLNRSVQSNLTLRPEVRWDWFEGNGLPFDDGTKSHQFTLAIDAVMLW